MLSYGEIRRTLCDSFTAAFPNSRGDILDIYNDHCIISDGTGILYEVPYSIDENGKVITGDMAKVRKQVDYVRVAAAARLLAAVDTTLDAEKGYQWHVQIIDAGPDKQGNIEYPYDVLKAAVPLYDGARVFALTQGQHANPKNPFGKSVRDLVGWISDAKPNSTGIEGTLNLLKTASWLRDALTDAFAKGKTDLIGLSHDVQGKVQKGRRIVESIVKVDSVDVVYDPIAGGKFIRMAAASQGQAEKEGTMFEKLLAALATARPVEFQRLVAAGKVADGKVVGGKITEDELVNLLAAAPAEPGASPAPNNEEAKAILEQTRIAACGITLTSELTGSGLPTLAEMRLRKQFEGKVFETTALQAAIKEEKEYLDKLTGSGVVTGSGQTRIQNEEPEKIQAAFDKMLGVDVDDKFKDVPALTGLRAAYTRLTGDADITGRPENFSRDAHRLAASYMEMMRLPAAYVSSSFTYLLGTSMYRRLVQDYKAVNYGEDILISYIRRAVDFKTMESIRVGYYGDLPDVTPETIDYAELTNVTDEEVSFALNQKGGIVTVSRATILNDDLRALQKLPQRLGRAAKRTYAQRVWNKIIDNATYKGDSKALFHSDHGNLGAVTVTNDATGVTTLANRLIAMYNQTEQDSSKKLALEAMYCWVPREKYELACGLNSPWPGVAGGNPHAGRFGVNHERIIKLALTTDTDDWGLVADKNDVELLEVAFMNGQQEPEFFVADNPLAGQMFLADKIQYKIRHEYEVEIDDYRGLDKSVI